jgi:hypothetical protein
MEFTMSWGTVAVIVALMMNLGGLVWGAAMFAGSVSRLEDDVIPRLLLTIDKLTALIQQHDKDIAVLKALGRRSTDSDPKRALS